MISPGNRLPIASMSSAFGREPTSLADWGNDKMYSTSGVSKNGTRTSSELHMLIASVSRRSVFSMYERNSSQETAVKRSSNLAWRTAAERRSEQGCDCHSWAASRGKMACGGNNRRVKKYG